MTGTLNRFPKNSKKSLAQSNPASRLCHRRQSNGVQEWCPEEKRRGQHDVISISLL